MPVKRGPKLASGTIITVDRRCLEPGCKNIQLRGELFCLEHVETQKLLRVSLKPDRKV